MKCQTCRSLRSICHLDHDYTFCMTSKQYQINTCNFVSTWKDSVNWKNGCMKNLTLESLFNWWIAHVLIAHHRLTKRACAKAYRQLRVGRSAYTLALCYCLSSNTVVDTWCNPSDEEIMTMCFVQFQPKEFNRWSSHHLDLALVPFNLGVHPPAPMGQVFETPSPEHPFHYRRRQARWYSIRCCRVHKGTLRALLIQ